MTKCEFPYDTGEELMCHRYLRGQKPGTLTAWIPVGDISPVSGGLMYLEDSLDLGIEMEGKFRQFNKNLPVDEQMNGFNDNVSD